MLTTPTDYANFLIEVIDPKASDAFRLNQASLKEMLRPHVKVPNDQVAMSWALGWQIFHDGKHDFIAHGGDNEGFHCYAAASTETKSAYVIMTNGENAYDKVVGKLMTGDIMPRFLLK